MNKFITLIALAYLVTLVSASWTDEDIIKANLCIADHKIIDCGGDTQCEQQIAEIKVCVDPKCSNKPESIGVLASCIRDCSENYKNEKVEKHYSDYVDCLGQNILAFATLLITIFFMLF